MIGLWSQHKVMSFFPPFGWEIRGDVSYLDLFGNLHFTCVCIAIYISYAYDF